MTPAWTERWVDIEQAAAAGMPHLPRPGVRLWSEGLGDPGQPVVLLVMGAMNQGIVWPDAFCTEIASAGFCVVRNDHRDTGLSPALPYTLPYAMQPYGLTELAADARAVAQAWAGKRPVHWIGMSMGGVLAQMAALDLAGPGSSTHSATHSSIHSSIHVASLTLMMTTPDLSVPARATTGMPQFPSSPLPLPLPAYLDYLSRSARDNSHTPAAVLDKMVDGWRAANGTAEGFDEAQTRALMQRTLERTTQPLGALNHVAATLSAHDLSAALGQLHIPTLVIHGADDPLVPPAHGEALVRAIPGAALLRVPGMGHMFDTRHLAYVTPQIILHLQNALRAAFADTAHREHPL